MCVTVSWEVFCSVGCSDFLLPTDEMQYWPPKSQGERWWWQFPIICQCVLTSDFRTLPSLTFRSPPLSSNYFTTPDSSWCGSQGCETSAREAVTQHCWVNKQLMSYSFHSGSSEIISEKRSFPPKWLHFIHLTSTTDKVEAWIHSCQQSWLCILVWLLMTSEELFFFFSQSAVCGCHRKDACALYSKLLFTHSYLHRYNAWW